MKRVYEKPSTTIIFMEIEGNLLIDSAHGAHHEGFTETTDPNLRVEDGTDDDSPF
ncbi:MAG: single-stranded DNA-binding protein [Prevotella sp.]|nr:single-stranded DNA-binding protein [Prevotella sp.]